MRNRFVINYYTIVNIFVLFILIVFAIVNWNINYLNHSWTAKISIASVLLLIYQIYSMKKNGIKLYDFRLWFSLFQYLFAFGRIYLNALGLDNDIFWNLMNYYDDVSMNRAALYALIYIQCMYLGLFFNNNKFKKNDEIKKDSVIEKKSSSKLFFIGIIMILLCIPFRIYNDYLTINAQRIANGYVSLAVDNAFFYALGLLLPVGFIYIIVSEKLTKKKLDRVLIIYAIYTVVMMMFSGDRRYAITSFLAIILCYIKTLHIKVGVKKIITYVIGGMFLLIMLATIRNARLYVINSFSDFSNMFVEIFTKSNFMYETLSEFGLTFFIYAAVIKFFPSHFNFKYGMTYLFAPFTIIPMSGTIFPGVQEAVSAHYDCKSITHQSLGAAFGEELYANFGFLSPIFAIICGIILSSIMNSRKINGENNKQKIVNYYCIFYILINLVRASTTEVFRLIAYAIIIPWFIGLFYKGRDKEVKVE